MARTRYQALDRPIPLRDLPAAALRAVLREGYAQVRPARRRAGGRRGRASWRCRWRWRWPSPWARRLSTACTPPSWPGSWSRCWAARARRSPGPTAAFIVILAPIYAKLGMTGLLLSGLMAGLMLILMGLIRLGKLIEFIPHPVTTGFTAGIATVIATLQIKDLLGLHLRHDARALRRAGRRDVRGARDGVGLGAAGRRRSRWPCCCSGRASTRRVPAAAGGAAHRRRAGGAASSGCCPGAHVATIASRFHTDGRRPRWWPASRRCRRCRCCPGRAGVRRRPPMPSPSRCCASCCPAPSPSPCSGRSSRCCRRWSPTAWPAPATIPTPSCWRWASATLITPVLRRHPRHRRHRAHRHQHPLGRALADRRHGPRGDRAGGGARAGARCSATCRWRRWPRCCCWWPGTCRR